MTDIINQIIISFGAIAWLTAISLVIAQQLFGVSLGLWLGLIAWIIAISGVVVFVGAAYKAIFG